MRQVLEVSNQGGRGVVDMTAASAAPRFRQPLRSRRVICAYGLPLLFLGVAAVVVPIRILEADGLPRYRTLKTELRRVERDNDRLRMRIRSLRAQVSALRSDPEAVEKIARDELGLVRSDEMVIHFEPREP